MSEISTRIEADQVSQTPNVPTPPVSDDSAEDERLLRLAESQALSREELRVIRTNLPASTIDYDDEPGLPY